MRTLPDRRSVQADGGLDESGTWRNWAGDQTCRPAAFERPRDLGELRAALTRARREGWTARVVGAGHSFTDGVLTDGLLLSLDHFDRIVEADPSSGRVRVEAGIRLSELNEALAARGLALENLGDIDRQSLAGATATGTHGTGAQFRNLSATIESIELMVADGSLLEVNEESDADAWRAARISLGALGVVTAITIKTVAAFSLRGRDEVRPLEVVLRELDELVAANDHFEFYTFPHSSIVMTRTNNRVDEPPRARSRSSAWLHDMFLLNHVYGAICRTGRRLPALIPSLNRLSARLSGSSERIDCSYRIFASPRLVRFTESEYAIPRRHATEAIRAIHKMIERGSYRVPIPLEVRFVAPDEALLSPAFGRDTCYIAAHMFEGMEWEPYFRSFQEIMDDLGGRPHWGKRHFQTAATLAPRYPEWARFAAVRSRLDPDGLFANEHVRRVLGPVAPPPGGTMPGEGLDAASRTD